MRLYLARLLFNIGVGARSLPIGRSSPSSKIAEAATPAAAPIQNRTGCVAENK